MWILIDNYDSFTYILLDYLKRIKDDILVFKNDEITIAEIEKLNPQRIILSPGPKRPRDAGILMKIIDKFHQKIPILGICLGHQALGEYFGCVLVKAKYPMHGKIDLINHSGINLFQGLPADLKVMRYHSLVLENFENTDLKILAYSQDNEVMAFQHNEYLCTGIQFHPESILTDYGFEMLLNWHNGIKIIKNELHENIPS